MVTGLLKELQELDEHPTLEAKACTGDVVGDTFYETVCAMSNEPDLGGGRIILGVSRPVEDLFGGYDVTGINDPDKILADIASGSAQRFNQPVRPRLTTERVGEKTVILVEVDELAPAQKPLYFPKQGLPRGAWRRVGSTDQRCTEDDLVVFYGSRQGDAFDLTVEKRARLEDFDPEAIAHYRRLRANVNPLAEELQWNDDELLQSLNAVQRVGEGWKPTLTGLLIFGSRAAHRRELPAVRVDYIRVPGKEWVDDPERRFASTIDMRGPLLALVDRAHAAIMDDLPKGFELKEGQMQADTPTLPSRVIREAIVNAVMHRSYREHRPTQIVRYANRIEIINAGFSLKSDELLGQPGSQLRNPHLAAIFHETNTAETKGSGIRVMQEQMRASGFSQPTFESDRAANTFTSRFLLHHFLQETDLEWLNQFPWDLSHEQRYALIFLREQGAINNQTLRQLTGSDVFAASQALRGLRDLLLAQQKGKGSATYYLPGANFPTSRQEHATLAAGHATLKGKHATLAPAHKTLKAQLPPELRRRVEEVGYRPGDRIRPIILQLCAWRALSASQLAEILNRKDSEAIRRDHLKPLTDSGELEYVYPDMERHPQQAYRTPAR